MFIHLATASILVEETTNHISEIMFLKLYIYIYIYVYIYIYTCFIVQNIGMKNNFSEDLLKNMK